jgi:hypothetical protein
MWRLRDLLPWLFSHILLKDPYIEPKVVKLPSKVANRITFEEQATDININILQEVVDKWLYLVVLVLTTQSSEQRISSLLDKKDTQHLMLDKSSVG